MLVHVDNVFMAEKPGTLKKINKMIKLKFNIQESGKVKKYLGVYYEWGCDAKGSYAKMGIEKDKRKLVEGYQNYTGSDVWVQRTPGAPGRTLRKSELELSKDMDNYKSFMGQLIWSTTKVGPDVAKVAREF